MTSDAPTPQRAARFAGAVLALLVAINMLNYIDRQVLAAVESLMQKDLFPEARSLRLAKARRRPAATRMSNSGWGCCRRPFCSAT